MAETLQCGQTGNIMVPPSRLPLVPRHFRVSCQGYRRNFSRVLHVEQRLAMDSNHVGLVLEEDEPTRI